VRQGSSAFLSRAGSCNPNPLGRIVAISSSPVVEHHGISVTSLTRIAPGEKKLTAFHSHLRLGARAFP
jgi:hypothetical protein